MHFLFCADLFELQFSNLQREESQSFAPNSVVNLTTSLVVLNIPWSVHLWQYVHQSQKIPRSYTSQIASTTGSLEDCLDLEM